MQILPLLAAVLAAPTALACTRGVLVADDNNVITIRSLDWFENIDTSLYVFPKGLKRDGASGADTVTWTSKCKLF